jgi:hypothetical protein
MWTIYGLDRSRAVVSLNGMRHNPVETANPHGEIWLLTHTTFRGDGDTGLVPIHGQHQQPHWERRWEGQWASPGAIIMYPHEIRCVSSVGAQYGHRFAHGKLHR